MLTPTQALGSNPYLSYDFSNIGSDQTDSDTAHFVTITAVAAVPEPASLTLLAVGSLILLRRRRERSGQSPDHVD